MSVHPCPECSGTVSTLAAACPHCGAPPKRRPISRERRVPIRRRTVTVLAGAALLVVVALVLLPQIEPAVASSARALFASGKDESPSEAGIDLEDAEMEAILAASGEPHPNSVPLGYYVGRSGSGGQQPAEAQEISFSEEPADTYDFPSGIARVQAPDGLSIEFVAGDAHAEGPEVGRIPEGTVVRVVGPCDTEGMIEGEDSEWQPWCPVEYLGRKGWAFSPYLIAIPAS